MKLQPFPRILIRDQGTVLQETSFSINNLIYLFQNITSPWVGKNKQKEERTEEKDKRKIDRKGVKGKRKGEKR